MRVACVYKEDTDYAREVSEWFSDFKYQTGKEVEAVDPESIEGEIFCRARDIVEYPTVVALADDGQVLKEWRGTPLPQIDEVAYYVREQ